MLPTTPKYWLSRGGSIKFVHVLEQWWHFITTLYQILNLNPNMNILFLMMVVLVVKTKSPTL